MKKYFLWPGDWFIQKPKSLISSVLYLKNNIKINYLAIITLTILTFSACKKDSKSSSDFLTSKTWKRGLNDKNISTNPSGAVLYSPVLDCEKDNTFKFGLDGNLFVNRNSGKCDQNELQIETQIYTLNRTTKELVINGNKFTLAEESNSQIKYYAAIPLSMNNEPRYLILLLQ